MTLTQSDVLIYLFGFISGVCTGLAIVYVASLTYGWMSANEENDENGDINRPH